jgi:hypothetical protein
VLAIILQTDSEAKFPNPQRTPIWRIGEKCP